MTSTDPAGNEPTDPTPDQQRLWDRETAQHYDTPGEGMFCSGK
jgi:hypothetical protein